MCVFYYWAERRHARWKSWCSWMASMSHMEIVLEHSPQPHSSSALFLSSKFSLAVVSKVCFFGFRKSNKGPFFAEFFLGALTIGLSCSTLMLSKSGCRLVPVQNWSSVDHFLPPGASNGVNLETAIVSLCIGNMECWTCSSCLVKCVTSKSTEKTSGERMGNSVAWLFPSFMV